MIKKLLHSKNQNYFCTFVIGKTYYENYKKYTYPLFRKYCKKNGIGIFVVTNHLIPKKNDYWKNTSWQKFLAPKIIKEKYKKIKSVCMIDSDVLINIHSPNIFDFHKTKSVSVVSLRKNMPYMWDETTRRISYFRNKFYSKKYPLDSAINISLKNLYKFHNLKPQKDEFCAGIYIVSENNFHKFYNFFYKFKKGLKTITSGGEQTHFNHFVQSKLNVNVLSYKFQAQWVFEMSNYYPFLYNKNFKNKKDIIKACIETSLVNNYFLHFAGSWFESSMWKNNLEYYLGSNFVFNFNKYKKIKLKGLPRGDIKPK